MTTYHELLRDHFVRKQKKNPEFSLRAFSRLLGLTPGGLSRLLRGQMSLSLSRAIEIAEKLTLNEKDTETFLNLIQLEKAKTGESKEKILKKLNRTRKQEVTELSVDHFKTISEWQPMAILRITAVAEMDRSAKGVAKTLGISSSEAMQALERLKRLDLVTEDEEQYSRISKQEVYTKFQHDHEAARKYYRQLMDRLNHNLETKKADSRAMSAQVLVLDEEQLETARKLTLEYHQKLVTLSEQSKTKKTVYQALTTVFEIKGK